MAISVLLFSATTAILTALRPVTVSSLLNGLNYPASYLVDNLFENFTSTAGTEVPWLNIQLAESAVIRSVVVIMRADMCFTRIGTTSIRVGTNSDPTQNTEC